MITREEAAAINVAWLGAIRGTLQLLVQVEPNRLQRWEYGKLLADASYYELQAQQTLEQLRKAKQQRSRATSNRRRHAVHV